MFFRKIKRNPVLGILCLFLAGYIIFLHKFANPAIVLEDWVVYLAAAILTGIGHLHLRKPR